MHSPVLEKQLQDQHYYETILLTVSLDTRPLFTRRRSRARLYSDQISDPRWFLLSLFCVNTHT